jgi:hypothetical protein
MALTLPDKAKVNLLLEVMYILPRNNFLLKTMQVPMEKLFHVDFRLLFSNLNIVNFT